MQWLHHRAILFYLTLCLSQVRAAYYNLSLSHDGPVMLGGTITFRADLYRDGERPSGTFIYKWRDNALTSHEYETPETSNVTTYYSISYDRASTSVGEYEMEVVVSRKELVFIWDEIASLRTYFVITSLVNGNLKISQANKTLENTFVSSSNEANMTVSIREGDYDYLAKKATAITTYWFIDCKYFGESSDLSFRYNFTNPNVSHAIDALVVASYDPPTTVPPPTTTTLPPSTTSAPTDVTTSNATSSNTTETTSAMPVTTTTAPSTTPVSTTIMSDDDTTGTTAGNIPLPYICSNSSIIPMDPKKSYGHFNRKIDVRAPIGNISVEGTNWIKPWEMLSLNVSCKGSGPFNQCLQFHRGKYNVTGNETCDEMNQLHSCNFSIIHYFLEPSVYTILVILNNDVSSQVYPLTVNIYKVTKKPQLSVIVVPVSCTLAAVIPIVFGVAYYIQSRARFTVEVADFDFGQNNPEMEYKTFRERLRDSFNNAINPGNKRISGYEPLSNPQTLQ